MTSRLRLDRPCDPGPRDRARRDGASGRTRLHAPAARGRLRRPAAPPARDRRPWRDRGAARAGRVAALTATGHRPAPGLRRLRPSVPPAGAAPAVREHLRRAKGPMAGLRGGGLDAEMVHAIAPRAALTILLVKGTSLDSADQAVAASVAALRRGASEGGIISLSPAGQIGGEHCVDHAQLTQLNAALQADADHHVTVVAATGDAGAAGEPCALIDALSGGISSSFTPRKEVSPRRLRPARPQRRGHDPRREPHDRRLDRRDHLGPSRRRPRHRLPGIGRGVQPSLPPALLPERCPRHWRNAWRPRRRRRRQPQPRHRASGRHEQCRRGLHDQRARRHERQRAHLGRDHRPRRPVRRTPPRLRQPGHLPDRPQLALPPGLPRHHRRQRATRPKFPHGTITGYRAGPGWDPVTGWGSPNAKVLVPLLASYASR